MNRFFTIDIHNTIIARKSKSKAESASGKQQEISSGSTENKDILTQFGVLAAEFDQSNDLIFIIDENANIVFSNKKACESLEYCPEELLAMSIEDIAPNIDEEILVQSSLVDYSSEGSINIDMYYKTKTQEILSVEVKISPFMSGARYFSLEAMDISARTPFYNFISNSENQDFFALVENFPVIILRYDLSFWCTYANEACEEIIGYPRYLISENFLGLSRFLSNEQICWMKHNLRLVIESGLPIEFELVPAHASTGLPVYLQVVVVPEFNAEHKITGVMVVAHDFSEQKHVVEEFAVALKLLEEVNGKKSFVLDSFNYNMSGLLNTLIDLSQLLKNETLTPEIRSMYIGLLDDWKISLIGFRNNIHSLLKQESSQ